MSNKILNLQLKYKNKLLDTVIYNRDFDNHFFIGNDKNMFWQILDDSFPTKFKLLSKTGSGFNINLHPAMKLTISKKGETLSHDYLVKNKILQDNILKLDDDSQGVISFKDVWTIEYFFKTPFAKLSLNHEVGIYKEFAHWPKLSPQDRFTRIFLLLGVIVTIIGLIIGESFYVPPPVIDFNKRLEIVHQVATKIEPDAMEAPVVEPEIEVDITQKKAETTEQAQKAVEKAEETSIAQYEDLFGSVAAVDEDYTSELFEIDLVGDIAVITDEPDASASNILTTSEKTQSVLDDVPKSSTSLSEIKESGGDIFAMEDFEDDTNLDFSGVELADLGGDAKDLDITRIESKKKFEAVKKQFSGIQKVSEKEIEMKEEDSEQSYDLNRIRQTVNTYKPQITKLYMVESMIIDMYGTIEFNLIIGGDGIVKAVDPSIVEGSFFTDDFLDKAKDIILKWKIPVTEPIDYSFRIQFIKQ